MARRSRRAPRAVDPLAQRRVRYQRALAALGLAADFARLPLRVREHFWRCKGPDPVLEFDPTFPPDPRLRAALEEALRDAMFDAEGSRMSVRDLLSVIVACLCVVELSPRSGQSEDVLRFFRVAQPRLRRFYEQHLSAASVAVHLALYGQLMANSRLDSRILAATWSRGELPDGRAFARFTLSAAEPQFRHLTLDGQSRPVYRVPRTTLDGVHWLSWTPEQLGCAAPADADGTYPVFVQSHALKQMYKRVNLPLATPYLDAWLAESLAEPRIVERLPGGDLLVEFRVHEHRLGYLVVSPTQGLAAVRTFLFLTMEPSPESRRLRDRLRLTRREVDWLGLSDLAAFTQTDLRDDEQLRPLLESFGLRPPLRPRRGRLHARAPVLRGGDEAVSEVGGVRTRELRQRPGIPGEIESVRPGSSTHLVEDLGTPDPNPI